MTAFPRPRTPARFALWALALVAALLAWAPAAPAAAQGMARLSDADKDDLRRIEHYLNGIGTMESRFLQVSSDGDYSEGTVYFSRPGKMRLDYDKPNPVAIVSDGVNLAYYDRELQQVSYYDLQATQAAILLRDKIVFGKGDILVTHFERGPGVIRVTVIKGTDPLEGNMTLIFSDKPLGLKKWAVTDAQGVVTNVSLLGPRFGVTLKDDLFHVELPQPDIK